MVIVISAVAPLTVGGLTFNASLARGESPILTRTVVVCQTGGLQQRISSIRYKGVGIIYRKN